MVHCFACPHSIISSHILYLRYLAFMHTVHRHFHFSSGIESKIDYVHIFAYFLLYGAYGGTVFGSKRTQGKVNCQIVPQCLIPTVTFKYFHDRLNLIFSTASGALGVVPFSDICSSSSSSIPRR